MLLPILLAEAIRWNRMLLWLLGSHDNISHCLQIRYRRTIVLSEQEMLSIISVPDQYTLAEFRRLVDSVPIFLRKKTLCLWIRNNF